MKRILSLSVLICILTVCLSACFGGVEFNLNFIVDGAVYDTVTTNGKEIVKIPEDPTKEGYTFGGWYWDNDVWEKPFTANSLLDAPISSNMSVYAKWNKNSDVHTHALSDWITDAEATCKADGAKHKECTECGEVLETGAIEKLDNHTPSEAAKENFVDSDCETGGSYVLVVYCSVCGEKLSSEEKIVEKKEHTPSDWITDEEATCKADGAKHKECTECEEVLETEEIEKLTTHTPADAVKEDFVDSTCEAEGSYNSVVYCSVCEAKISSEAKTVEKKEHTPSDWITDAEATCKADGAKHKECTECGEVLEGAVVDKIIEHTYSDDTDEICNVCGYEREVVCLHQSVDIIVGKEATCIESGLSDGKVCLTCGAVLEEQKEIPAAHKESIIPRIEPQCTVCGWTEGKQCNECYEVLVEPSPIRELGHSSGDWIVIEPTDTEPGERYKVCTRCGETTEWEHIPILITKPQYVKEDNYIYFGEYPQTIKADDVTITQFYDERGYHIGSDGCSYAAVTVLFDDGQGSGYKFSSGKTVENKQTYYFKVEPIRWRILSESDGNATIMCDMIIDVGIYGTKGTKNNYAMSEIRRWLNDNFYVSAFNDLQRQIIVATNVDNSAASTGYAQNPYACENTYDFVYLLSYKDALNSGYGFETIAPFSDESKMLITSDYTRALGAWMSTSKSNYGAGIWWLRSPEANKYGTTPTSVYAIQYDGSVGGGQECTGSYGIVPVLKIKL